MTLLAVLMLTLTALCAPGSEPGVAHAVRVSTRAGHFEVLHQVADGSAAHMSGHPVIPCPGSDPASHAELPSWSGTDVGANLMHGFHPELAFTGLDLAANATGYGSSFNATNARARYAFRKNIKYDQAECLLAEPASLVKSDQVSLVGPENWAFFVGKVLGIGWFPETPSADGVIQRLFAAAPLWAQGNEETRAYFAHLASEGKCSGPAAFFLTGNGPSMAAIRFSYTKQGGSVPCFQLEDSFVADWNALPTALNSTRAAIAFHEFTLKYGVLFPTTAVFGEAYATIGVTGPGVVNESSSRALAESVFLVSSSFPQNLSVPACAHAPVASYGLSPWTLLGAHFLGVLSSDVLLAFADWYDGGFVFQADGVARPDQELWAQHAQYVADLPNCGDAPSQASRRVQGSLLLPVVVGLVSLVAHL